MKTIKCNSDSQKFITDVFLEYMKSGYQIVKAYQRRKYYVFGKMYYFIEMQSF